MAKPQADSTENVQEAVRRPIEEEPKNKQALREATIMLEKAGMRECAKRMRRHGVLYLVRERETCADMMGRQFKMHPHPQPYSRTHGQEGDTQ